MNVGIPAMQRSRQFVATWRLAAGVGVLERGPPAGELHAFCEFIRARHGRIDRAASERTRVRVRARPIAGRRRAQCFAPLVVTCGSVRTLGTCRVLASFSV